MMRAHTADPRDPEVLLALGVSHTNELSQWEAVRHLRSWLAAQPAYTALDAAAGEAPDTSQRLTHVVSGRGVNNTPRHTITARRTGGEERRV